MEKIKGQVIIADSRQEEIGKEANNLLEYKSKIDEYLSFPITDLLEIILAGAINLKVSDIHFEPEEKRTKLRIRADGLLQDVLFFDLKIHERLASRIKLLSGLKLNIVDRAQDGRFSVLMKPLAVEIRASALPAEYGESLVLRILNPESLIEMPALGLRPDLLKIMETEIKKPNGMIIATGPTGCGKTTSLYAFLKKIVRPEIKIITIEDPIEYHLENISQTQVDPQKGYNFASGLRSIMRQDPDVILVGEIRDQETVDIAIQAALTGHLVFSTVHTNDAIGVIARLRTLGAKLSNIGPAINVIIAQRLVRRLCQKCKQTSPATPEELMKIKKELTPLLTASSVATVLRDLPSLNNDLEIFRAVGCPDCNQTGYRQRTGIFEILLLDEEMEKIIIRNPVLALLKEEAVKRGMTTMKQDGFLKVLQGITTVEEVERIMGE